jgi:uncharacterized protein YmfQ (DUF2313 family)
LASCPSSSPAPFTCPTLEQSIQATAALLPRGKAWPANDGGGTMANFLAWLAGTGYDIWSLTDIWTPPDIWNPNYPQSPADWPAGYVQCGFIAALGTVRNWIESRFCQLKAEFFCSSASETLDLWYAEYGLPDQCDPFPDLCTKVALVGGTPNCNFWTSVAAAMGWAIECSDYHQGGGSQFGNCQCGTAEFGGGIIANQINITVLLAESPAYAVLAGRPPIFGIMEFGDRFSTAPNITPLTCAFDRIRPAHINFVFNSVDA